MNQDSVKAWLKVKKSSGATNRCLLAFVTLLGAAVVLFLTFWITYAVIWICFPGVSAVSEMAFSKKLKLTHEWQLALNGVFIALLFIQHFRTSPWYWSDYSDESLNESPDIHNQSEGSYGAERINPHATAKMLADIVLSGPKLFSGSWNLWRESRRFGAMDEDFCSQLLGILASRHSAVPFEELREAGWEEHLSQLRCIDGIIFLEKGICLTPELRRELLNLNLDQTYAPI